MMRNIPSERGSLGTVIRPKIGLCSGKTDRGGYSLAELLVVMTIMSVVLGLVATMLTALLRENGVASREREIQNSLSRLARQIRKDMRAAESIERVEASDTELPASRFVCKLPDGARVVYAMSENIVTRSEERDDGLSRRESYSVARGTSIELIDQKELPTGMVEVVVTYSLGDSRGKQRRRPIRGLLGRDGRLVATKTNIAKGDMLSEDLP